MKRWFAARLKKIRCTDLPPMPPREAIIEALYEKHLDAFADEVVKVIYSKDRAKRYVILKSKQNFFTYQLEEISFFDDEERRYIAGSDVFPAMWAPAREDGRSFFGTEADLLRALTAEPEFRSCFEPLA